MRQRNGLKLLGVGFGASLFGVGCTNLLIGVRQLMDPGFAPQNPPQDVITMSAAYASYMAVSSNLRYQVTLTAPRVAEAMHCICHTCHAVPHCAASVGHAKRYCIAMRYCREWSACAGLVGRGPLVIRFMAS